VRFILFSPYNGEKEGHVMQSSRVWYNSVLCVRFILFSPYNGEKEGHVMQSSRVWYNSVLCVVIKQRLTSIHTVAVVNHHQRHQSTSAHASNSIVSSRDTKRLQLHLLQLYNSYHQYCCLLHALTCRKIQVDCAKL
jgi:hypothetical protein